MLSILIELMMLVLVSSDNRARIWLRIPPHYVDSRVSGFLNENRIVNCFEFRETETNLLLKCWRDNKLTDVSININPMKQKRYFGIALSV
tara:strand:- start:12670 stop:12939 length:270 start_codon:yes stop_codon:yes gene_type:complete